MKRFRKNRKGFTLVEELVTIVLVSMLVLLASGIMMNALRVLANQVIMLNAQKYGVSIMDTMEPRVAYAHVISASDADLTADTKNRLQSKITVGVDANGHNVLQADTTFFTTSGSTGENMNNILVNTGSYDTKLTFSDYDATNHTLKMRVDVLKNGHSEYAAERTIALMNGGTANVNIGGGITVSNAAGQICIGSVE